MVGSCCTVFRCSTLFVQGLGLRVVDVFCWLFVVLFVLWFDRGGEERLGLYPKGPGISFGGSGIS